MNSKFPASLTLETVRVRIEVISQERLKELFPLDEVEKNNELIYLSIAQSDDDNVIGWMSLQEKESSIEITHIWIDEIYRGGKNFREAIFSILNFCLNVLKTPKVEVFIPKENFQAKSAFLKVAFIPQQVRVKENDPTQDLEEFNLFTEEWPLRATQFFGDIL